MMHQNDQPLIISGSSHPALAAEIAEYLKTELGKIEIATFPDGEISIEILQNVRGRSTFVVQSIAQRPNHYLMELLIIMDALRRASAKNIVVVLSYFGYCRQDRKDRARVPITAKLVANLLVAAGATRVVTIDLHAGQLQGFFDIPVDHLCARILLADAFKKMGITNALVVAPDIGSIKVARAFANLNGSKLAVIDKQRSSAKEVQMQLIGDVKDQRVILVDDLCATGGTLASAAELVMKKGAKEVFAAVTHGLFADNALELIQASPIQKIVVANTVPLRHTIPKLQSISITPLLSLAIMAIMKNSSISLLNDGSFL